MLASAGEKVARWCKRNPVVAGLLAALVLCLSGRFVYLGRMLVLDGVLALCVAAALAAAHQALVRWRWRWWLLAAVCAGLGLLTKGPVALALVLPPVAAALLYRSRLHAGSSPGVAPPGSECRQRLRVGYSRLALRLLIFIALALAVAAPWYGSIADGWL